MAKANSKMDGKKARARLTDSEIALIAELHRQHRGDFRKVAARCEAPRR